MGLDVETLLGCPFARSKEKIAVGPRLGKDLPICMGGQKCQRAEVAASASAPEVGED